MADIPMLNFVHAFSLFQPYLEFSWAAVGNF
jgi:hypothetical protein